MTTTPLSSRPWFSKWFGIAWCAYGISLFLPAIPDTDGWECAKASFAMLWEAAKGDKEMLIYGSYTLPNLFMVLSPILFPLFRSRRLNVVWLACATGFIVHVLSFLLLSATGDGWPKIGYYVWLASFVALALGTFNIRRRQLALQGDV